ncbi:Tim44 domain-containing protein [Halothiobacillus sp. DCM-1]|uniref:Tim44 domain-containing protein n=1 Tax=Halothiobacillus sp. DCM-1 TaxID=3112558 RepID=UPI0032448CBF
MLYKKLSSWALLLTLGLGLVALGALQTAEAKRIGGGSNLGQQKHSYSRQATAPAAAPAGTAAAPAKAAPNGNRWLGPLAGLAAGGLLAALFFGGAFDGLTPVDFIIMLIFGVGAYFLIRALRQKSRPAAPAYAGHPAAPSAQGRTAAIPPVSAGSPPADLIQAPAWFNETQFLEAAKTHFTNLQKSWDNNDMESMREYFTPTLFAELSQERARMGEEFNVTEVQSLNAQLLDLSHEPGDVVVASVLFQGVVRENYGQPESIAEVWHVRHPASSPQGDWLISGIQQYQHLVH